MTSLTPLIPMPLAITIRSTCAMPTWTRCCTSTTLPSWNMSKLPAPATIAQQESGTARCLADLEWWLLRFTSTTLYPSV